MLINPHVNPSAGDEAWRYLCTVGLVFKLAHGLLKRLRGTPIVRHEAFFLQLLADPE